MSDDKSKDLQYEEIVPKTKSGMFYLLLNLFFMILSIVGLINEIIIMSDNSNDKLGVTMIIAFSIYISIVGPIMFCGLKVLKPKEALVLTLFGKYYGTLKGEGFYFVNPFVTAINPAAATLNSHTMSGEKNTSSAATPNQVNIQYAANKKISLKAITLNNEKQKINDQMGNPIIIGIVVIWRVVNTAKAVFNVDT